MTPAQAARKLRRRMKAVHVDPDQAALRARVQEILDGKTPGGQCLEELFRA